MTKCRDCNAILTKGNRSNRRQNQDICKPCWNTYQKEWRKKHPEKHKQFQRREREKNREAYADRTLRYLYGITLEEKRQMWRDQDGKCALCGKELLKSKECNVDHDHKTGIVRRLLCSRCNPLMAAIDEAAFLQKAIAYRQEFLPDNHPEKTPQAMGNYCLI